MTDPSPHRKAHIKRFVGTNANGDMLTDLTADMLRLDEIKVRLSGGDGKQYALKQWKTMRIHWGDEAGEDGNVNRETRIVKLCDRSEDPRNPSEWIEIPIIISWKTRVSDFARTGNGNDTVKKNKFNVPDETFDTVYEGYEYVIVRVPHMDTNIDDDPQYAEGGVIPFDSYEKDTTTTDEDNGVDAIIPTKIMMRVTNESHTGSGDDTKKIRTFNNAYLIEEFSSYTPDNTSAPPFNPSWAFDPYQYLYNVNFGALAVEFQVGQKISLLSGAPNTKRFVSAVWFRLPGEAVDRALASTDPIWGATIPIVKLGPPTVVNDISFEQTGSTGGYPYQNWTVGLDSEGNHTFTPEGTGITITGPVYDYIDAGSTHLATPSFIGIAVNEGKPPSLVVRIVMSKDNTSTMDGGGVYAKLDSFSATDSGGLYLGSIEACVEITDGPLAPEYTISSLSTHSSAQIALGASPEVFEAGGFTNLGDPLIPVTTNHWHCAIVIVDVTSSINLVGGFKTRNSEQPCILPSGICGLASETTTEEKGKVTSTCKMYVSLDRVNFTGASLTNNRADDAGDNDILTVNAYKMYSDIGYDITDAECVVFGRKEIRHATAARPTFSFKPDNIPLFGNSIDFPAPLEAQSHIEVGEFQLFTDSTGDTASNSLISCFINDEGRPAPMKRAEEFFGKKPERKLHGAGNWKKAIDTGTFSNTDGIYVDGIQTYRPNPSLNGKQGTPQ